MSSRMRGSISAHDDRAGGIVCICSLNPAENIHISEKPPAQRIQETPYYMQYGDPPAITDTIKNAATQHWLFANSNRETIGARDEAFPCSDLYIVCKRPLLYREQQEGRKSNPVEAVPYSGITALAAIIRALELHSLVPVAYLKQYFVPGQIGNTGFHVDPEFVFKAG